MSTEATLSHVGHKHKQHSSHSKSRHRNGDGVSELSRPGTSEGIITGESQVVLDLPSEPPRKPVRRTMAQYRESKFRHLTVQRAGAPPCLCATVSASTHVPGVTGEGFHSSLVSGCTMFHCSCRSRGMVCYIRRIS